MEIKPVLYDILHSKKNKLFLRFPITKLLDCQGFDSKNLFYGKRFILSTVK